MTAIGIDTRALLSDEPQIDGTAQTQRSGMYAIGSDIGLHREPACPPEHRADAWTACAASYEVFARGVTRPFARDAARLVRINAGSRVLDVATGTGEFAFAAAHRGARVFATDFSPSMLGLLRSRCRRKGISEIATGVMDGQALRLQDESFDVAGSLFGLVFFPQPERGLAELYRVLKPGGQAVVGTWAPPARVELMRLVGEAMMSLQVELPQRSPEASDWTAFSCKKRLRDSMTAAGFTSVHVVDIAHVWTFERVEEFAEALPKMTPSWMEVATGLTQEQLASFRTSLTDSFRQRQGAGPFAVTASGLVAVGTKGERDANR